MTHHLTVEARDKPAITALRLLTVLTVLFRYAGIFMIWALSGARLVLTAFSRTSPHHVVTKAA